MRAPWESRLCLGRFKELQEDTKGPCHLQGLAQAQAAHVLFCSHDERLVTSLCSQWLTSGLEEQWQISTFSCQSQNLSAARAAAGAAPVPSVCTLPTLFLSGPRFDGCTAETDPDTTVVAVMPLCPWVTVTDGCHGVL